MDNIQIQYRFELQNKRTIEFTLDLDSPTMTVQNINEGDLPEWTQLEHQQCSHCPLSKSDTKTCPAAANLAGVTELFNDILSYEELTVEAILPDRTVIQKTSAQTALSSLMGLLISTSNCPYTAFFKSMARHHLPLASQEETLFRASASYLLSQYFLGKSNEQAGQELSGLEKIYNDMQLVNRSIVQRIRVAVTSDAALNALIVLDSYAQSLPLAIEDSLEQIRYLFAPYHDTLPDQKKA